MQIKMNGFYESQNKVTMRRNYIKLRKINVVFQVDPEQGCANSYISLVNIPMLIIDVDVYIFALHNF